MKIDRKVVNKMRLEIEAILAKYAEGQEGLSITLGNARFNESMIDFKLHVKAKVEVGGVQTFDQYAADFKLGAPLYGVPADYLGKPFSANGKQLILTGYVRSNRTKKFVATGSKGETYRLDARTLRHFLGLPADARGALG